MRRNPVAPIFWAWLEANTSRIQSGLKQSPQRASEEIGRAFNASYPDLVWEITPAASSPWLFCVSANGKPDLFPKVQDAVGEAPAVKGWKIQAFRPRGSLNAVIDMGGATLGYDDIWCSVRLKDRGVSVTLWIRNLTRETDAAIGPAALILLDNAVGEYDAVTKIKDLGRGPLPPNPQRRDDFFPLADLPRYLDGGGIP